MNVLNTAWGSVLSSTVLVLALLPTGCSQSGSTRNDDSGKDEVSIGYGTQPREESTSSVEKIDADDQRHPMTRAEEMLEGVPGVQLLRAPGGGIWVRVRGVNSIYGSNEPLYVVDGMPVQVNPGQGLSWLNPRDIATIEVLKDASSTAIYGSRGANGVVIITTKR